MGSKKTIVRRGALPTINHSLPENMPTVLKKIYLNRGVTAQEEVQNTLAGLLPFKALMNINKATELLQTTLQQQQRILIIGDFDADGATSTTLAVSALRAFGAKQVDYLIPNRFDYGYGLSPEIVEVAAKRKPNLIITVDNGISSHAGVELAHQYGIKVLITDHHLAPEILPAAEVIINPNQPNDSFPSKAIAGVGVIFYVMLALRSRLRESQWFSQHQLPEPNMAQFLDLVALGTIADVVSLDHNNRILVQQGLQRIRSGLARVGIRALLQVSQRNPQQLCASDLGYTVGPRLNAAGRLEDMSLGVACLLSEDWLTAMQMAYQLDNLNQERRHIERDMLKQAEVYLEKLSITEESLALCLYHPDWHQGVIGILAGRIKDRYHRPTIVFAKVNDEELKGSARSISQLHLRDTLAVVATQHPELISKFGGHAMAAGLTIKLKDYSAFCAAFYAAVTRQLNGITLNNEVVSDGELSEQELTIQTADLLRHQGPWGQGFPEPLFDGKFEVVDQQVIADKHLKLKLQCTSDQHTIEAIAFNYHAVSTEFLGQIHIAYKLDINEYGGQRKLQLLIEHIEKT